MSKTNLSQDEVTKLPKSLIQVGIPIAFPIYDVKGQLLMQKGTVVASEDQLERLQERGLYLNKKTIDQLPSSQPLKETKKPEQAEEPERKEKLIDFNLSDLKLGETLHMSPLTDETNSTKYIVKFLGGLEKGSIIFSAPTLDDKLIFVKEGSGFLFRLFSGKRIYRFTSIITAIYNKPYPHIHLKFPQGAYALNIRQDHRADANIISSIINQTSDEFKNTKFSGRIVNMSLGGAAIEVNTPIGNMGDIMECKFKLEILKKRALLFNPLCFKKVRSAFRSRKDTKTHAWFTIQRHPI